MAKNKYYVVWSGRNPGIYGDWETCKKEIDGCKDAKYKGFPDRLSAETAFRATDNLELVQKSSLP